MVALRELGFLAMGLALVGCARYATSGGPANMRVASAWTNEAAVDQTRRRVEAEAFSKLVGNLEGMWSGVVNNVAQVQ